MADLRPDPHPTDLAAWQEQLADLRKQAPSGWRDGMIEMTEAHIAALLGASSKPAPEAL